MIRKIEYGNKYKKMTKDTYDKYQHIKGYNKKIDADLAFVLDLLSQDKPIPARFKDHKVGEDGNIPIRELHLVARGSDCLLVYEKYSLNNEPILYVFGVTDHDGMSKILHGSVLLIDLSDDELENTVFS